jgi:prepilin-type N-terminal cleavage/methylation domain-containing protein
MKKKPLSQDGFTLVELLVSIVVAAIVVMSLNQVVTTYLHVSQRGRYLNLANSFAEAKMEALRNTGYNGLSNGTTTITSELPAQLPLGKSATLVVANGSSGGLKRIDLSVTYKDQGQSYTYGYTTYIGELGVGQ